MRKPFREHFDRDEVESNTGKTAGNNKTFIKSGHDLLAGAQLDKVGSDDGRYDRDAAQDQRIAYRGRIIGKGNSAQQHCGNESNRVRLKEVGSHAGAVTNIVPDVVGDNRGVAGIVLGNTGLNLTHQVGAHVSPFGEDAAAESCEDGDKRTAEAETDELAHHVLDRRVRHQFLEYEVVTGYAEEA